MIEILESFEEQRRWGGGVFVLVWTQKAGHTALKGPKAAALSKQ